MYDRHISFKTLFVIVISTVAKFNIHLVILMEFELDVLHLIDIHEINCHETKHEQFDDYWDLFWSLDIDCLFRGLNLFFDLHLTQLLKNLR